MRREGLNDSFYLLKLLRQSDLFEDAAHGDVDHNVGGLEILEESKVHSLVYLFGAPKVFTDLIFVEPDLLIEESGELRYLEVGQRTHRRLGFGGCLDGFDPQQIINGLCEFAAVEQNDSLFKGLGAFFQELDLVYLPFHPQSIGSRGVGPLVERRLLVARIVE